MSERHFLIASRAHFPSALLRPRSEINISISSGVKSVGRLSSRAVINRHTQPHLVGLATLHGHSPFLFLPYTPGRSFCPYLRPSQTGQLSMSDSQIYHQITTLSIPSPRDKMNLFSELIFLVSYYLCPPSTANTARRLLPISPAKNTSPKPLPAKSRPAKSPTHICFPGHSA